uniref:Uncharacterized protein n=1 Tax=Anguilla anguilla TaxID=7936 RepID=A0A0E9RZZ1_ANGAN
MNLSFPSKKPHSQGTSVTWGPHVI